ncbi:hypothetical protein C5L38_25490 [Streptomyces sp. WAC00288]|uniref:Beta-lactamase n=1 Tax=Streptomyces cinereoruber TaxID=67260 RepID=A0ABX6BEC5_9ACTN|nr:hypothetical protein C5L38_25490 [Streptomyces sp. WAC00288]QEV32268.1 hypothetical protein CP977_08900 [Streptomyces cinereoruber]
MKLSIMITSRRARLRAWALLGALLGASGTAWPAEAHRAPAPCTSSREPALAARLSQDITTALRGRDGTVSVALHDPGRGLRCRVDDTLVYDSASLAKVLILEAVLGRAAELGRAPTRTESQRMRAMITRSDNKAAGELWKGLSRARLDRVLRDVGARDTVPGHGGYWGLTRTTARDQLALLAAVSRRAEALSLMGRVVRDQAWGVTAGAPRTVEVHLKNGWLPRATHAWRVHSVGVVRPAAGKGKDGGAVGKGRGGPAGAGGASATDYRLALLSHGNPTMRYGIRTLEGVAMAVHRRLSGGAAARGFTPAENVGEVTDGSAPAGSPGAPGASAPPAPPAPGSEGSRPDAPPAERTTHRGTAPPPRTARARRRARRRPRNTPSE